MGLWCWGCTLSLVVSDEPADVREYLIETGRAAAYFAFHPLREDGQSAIAYFAGQRRAINGNRRRPRFAKDFAGGRSEVLLRREMGFDQVHGSNTRPGGFSRPNLAKFQKFHGRVHRHISELPEEQRLWVHGRYRAHGKTRAEHRKAYRQLVFAQYEAEHLKGCKPDTRRLCRYWIEKAFWCHQFGYNDVSNDRGVVKLETWRKVYRPHWDRIYLRACEVDEAAMHDLGLFIDR